MWHLPPDYIAEHWTRELLNLMLTKYVERMSETQKEITRVVPASNDIKVSDADLFRELGKKINVIKKS